MAAAEDCGVEAVDCGLLPTPALALAAAGEAAVMVTGSHIPADRNGLKFYLPAGEISKAEEVAISAAFKVEAATFGARAGADTTDGQRMSIPDGRVVHLRPSGNALEFRAYVEPVSRAEAAALLAEATAAVRAALARL